MKVRFHLRGWDLVTGVCRARRGLKGHSRCSVYLIPPCLPGRTKLHSCAALASAFVCLFPDQTVMLCSALRWRGLPFCSQWNLGAWLGACCLEGS